MPKIDYSPEAKAGNWWSYMGYACTVEGISYCCPVLKLRGYPDDLALHRAIRRKVAQLTKKAAHAAMGG